MGGRIRLIDNQDALQYLINFAKTEVGRMIWSVDSIRFGKGSCYKAQHCTGHSRPLWCLQKLAGDHGLR